MLLEERESDEHAAKGPYDYALVGGRDLGGGGRG